MSIDGTLVILVAIALGLWLRRRLNHLELMVHMLALPAPPPTERDKRLLTVGCNEEDAAREIRREEMRRDRQSFARFLAHLRSIEEYQMNCLRQGADAIAPELDEMRQEISRREREARKSLATWRS